MDFNLSPEDIKSIIQVKFTLLFDWLEKITLRLKIANHCIALINIFYYLYHKIDNENDFLSRFYKLYSVLNLNNNITN